MFTQNLLTALLLFINGLSNYFFLINAGYIYSISYFLSGAFESVFPAVPSGVPNRSLVDSCNNRFDTLTFLFDSCSGTHRNEFDTEPSISECSHNELPIYENIRSKKDLKI